MQRKRCNGQLTTRALLRAWPTARCPTCNQTFPPSLISLLEARACCLSRSTVHAPSRGAISHSVAAPHSPPVLLPCRRIELGQLLPRVWVEARSTLLIRFAPVLLPVRGSNLGSCLPVFGSKRVPQNPATAAAASAPAAYLACRLRGRRMHDRLDHLRRGDERHALWDGHRHRLSDRRHWLSDRRHRLSVRRHRLSGRPSAVRPTRP